MNAQMSPHDGVQKLPIQANVQFSGGNGRDLYLAGDPNGGRVQGGRGHHPSNQRRIAPPHGVVRPNALLHTEGGSNNPDASDSGQQRDTNNRPPK